MCDQQVSRVPVFERTHPEVDSSILFGSTINFNNLA